MNFVVIINPRAIYQYFGQFVVFLAPFLSAHELISSFLSTLLRFFVIFVETAIFRHFLKIRNFVIFVAVFNPGHYSLDGQFCFMGCKKKRHHSYEFEAPVLTNKMQ